MRLRWFVVTCVLIGSLCVASVAQASDASVRSAIETAGKQAKESPELQGALKEIKSDPKTIAKLQKALTAFETTLRKAASTVAAQEASSENGRKGRSDWLGGIHKLIRGFEDLGTAVGDIKDGHKTAAKSELKLAAAAIKAGGAEGKTGQALLGVKR
jgi:hypothetical protein